MAKKTIPDVDTDDIEMSARDFPSASRRLDVTAPPAPPAPSAPPEASPREAPPPAFSSPPPVAAAPAPASTPQSRSSALVLGATAVACIAAIISVAMVVFGLSGVEESAPAVSPPAEAATAPAPTPAPTPAAVAPAPTPAETTSQLLSLTMLDLSRALETARPYESEVRAVQALAGDDADVEAFVDAVEPYGATGVGTLADIRASMPMLAEDIRIAIAAGERSWTKRTAASLRSILTFWRPADTPVDEAAKAALAIAAEQLADGRIEGAIATLGALEGPARQAAAPVMEEMERRLAVDRTAGALTELALNRLAGRD